MLETIVFQTPEAPGGTTTAPVKNQFASQKTDNSNAFQNELDSVTKNDASTIEPTNQAAANDEEFGFGDLIDMVNPLHHIPIVGEIYRGTTGDDIKPFSRIAGGAVFGGITGAGSALLNVIVEHETGTDLAGNVLGLAAENEHQVPSSSPGNSPADDPAIRLGEAIKSAQTNATASFPSESALSFIEKNDGSIEIYQEKNFSHDDERSAGPIMHIWKQQTPTMPETAREPITTFYLDRERDLFE